MQAVQEWPNVSVHDEHVCHWINDFVLPLCHKLINSAVWWHYYTRPYQLSSIYIKKRLNYESVFHCITETLMTIRVQRNTGCTMEQFSEFLAWVLFGAPAAVVCFG